MAYIQAHRQAGDAIYLIGEGTSPSRPGTGPGNVELYCYWRHPEPPVFAGMPNDLSEIPSGRFWVTFAFLPRHGTTYLDPLLTQLGTVAVEKDRLVVKQGGAAFLFETKPKDEPPTTQQSQ